VVSAAGADDDVIDALAAGAAGYLTKDAEARDIRPSIRAVANGQMYVSPTLASYLIVACRGAR
jgi:DNA-binding NarL/FixJ family response regulator